MDDKTLSEIKRLVEIHFAFDGNECVDYSQPCVFEELLSKLIIQNRIVLTENELYAFKRYTVDDNCITKEQHEKMLSDKNQELIECYKEIEFLREIIILANQKLVNRGKQ